MRTSAIFLLYILSIVCLLCGCKASQQTDTKVQRDYSGDWQRLSSQMDSLRAGFQLSQQRVTDKLSNLKVEHTTTYYTLPDSTGRQYPVYVSTTKADKDEQTTERIRTEMEAYIREIRTIVDSLSRKVDAALKKEQKVAELSWWDRHKWRVGIGAGMLVLVVVGYMVYRMRRR